MANQSSSMQNTDDNLEFETRHVVNGENEMEQAVDNRDNQTEHAYVNNSTESLPTNSDVVRVNKEDQPNVNSECIMEPDMENNVIVPAGHWYAIDVSMLPAKLTYFFDQAKEASIWPYLVLFQVSIGLSPAQAGIINGLRFIGCLFGAPLWGMLADQTRIHRPLIMMICAFAILFQCSQPFWGEAFGPKDKNVCPSMSNETLKEAEKEQESGKVHNSKLFYTLLIISMTACLFDGTTLTFVDSGVQRKIKASTKPVDFGRQRLFGSVGYAVGSVVSSAGVRYFPTAGVTCYAGMFCIYLFFTLCLLVNFSYLYKGLNATSSDVPTRNTANPKVRQLLWKTLKSFDIIFFLATVLFNGLMRALVFSFTYLYLKELGAPTMLLGISMVVSQIASLIMYALAQKIIDIVGGTMKVMCLSCFSWVIRLLCLAYMKNYYLILPINALNGVSASLFVAASIIHVRNTCPPAAFTSMYGIRNSLFNGGGYIIANVVGGELYQIFGPKKLFIYACIICAVWVVIMITYIVMLKYKRNSTRVSDIHSHDGTNNISLQERNNISTIARVA